MTRIDIPIRLRFLKIPTRWELRTVQGDSHHEACLYAFPTCLSDDSLDAFKVTELDAWMCRDEFFAIPENDNNALIGFLEKVGMWFRDDELSSHWAKEITQHLRAGNPTPLVVSALWKFQKSLRRALINKNAFKETYAPTLGRPQTGLQLLQESRASVEFPLRLELTNVATGAITLTDAYHMLLSTVFFDVARGIRFKVCQRKDCGKPFPLETKHDKKFCEWYCAHITTVRKNRPRVGKKKGGKIVRGHAKKTLKRDS